MANYKIFFKKTAQKKLEQLPQQEVQKIVKRLYALEKNPRPMRVERLSGHEEKYRIRQGNYRVVYSIQDSELIIWIIKIAHHKEIYRKL